MSARLPLAGIRVANFGWAWTGPVAGQTLRRLGAEVYKIESRTRVDINRTIPPFAPGHEHDPDFSLQNHAAWAGNGSITLDLKKPEAQELARDFIGHCDLVLENFSPGVLERLGLGHARLAERRPVGRDRRRRLVHGRPAISDELRGLSAIPRDARVGVRG